MNELLELLYKIDPNNRCAFESIYSYVQVCSNRFGWIEENQCIEECSSDSQDSIV